jgi:hypothetical protein
MFTEVGTTQRLNRWKQGLTAAVQILAAAIC